MKQFESNLSGYSRVNLDQTINSGQVFLWKKIGSKWYGIDGHKILVLQEFQKFDKNMKYELNFFRLDDNFRKISRDLKKDKIV